MKQAVQNIFKFTQILYFVEDDIIILFVPNAFLDKPEHDVRIAQILIGTIVQRYFNYVILWHTAAQQVIMKQAKEQIRLSTSSNARYNFYQTIFLFANQFVQINIPLDFHTHTPFRKKVQIIPTSEYIIPDLHRISQVEWKNSIPKKYAHAQFSGIKTGLL